MESEHDNGWTPRAVWVNTAATVLGALTGIAALVVAVIAILRTGGL